MLLLCALAAEATARATVRAVQALRITTAENTPALCCGAGRWPDWLDWVG